MVFAANDPSSRGSKEHHHMIGPNRGLLAACAVALMLGAAAPAMAQQESETRRPSMTSYIVVFYTPREGAPPRGPEVSRAHFDFLKAEIAAGTIRLAGPMQDGPFIGMIVMSVPDRAAARAIIDRDPMVAGGFVEVSLQSATLPNLDAVLR